MLNKQPAQIQLSGLNRDMHLLKKKKKKKKKSKKNPKKEGSFQGDEEKSMTKKNILVIYGYLYFFRVCEGFLVPI